MTRIATILAALVCLAVGAGLAEADDPAEAVRLYDEGQAAFDAGTYDAALAAWQKSYELSREPGLLFNLAQAYRLRAAPGDCTKAAETYRRFITQDPASAQRALAEAFAQDTERCAAAERSAAQPVAAAPPPATNLGTTPVAGTAESPPLLTRRRTIALGVAGAGAVFLIVGAVNGRQVNDLEGRAHELCGTEDDVCSDFAAANEHLEDARDKARLANLGFGLAAASVAGATILWVTGRAPADRGVGITPSVGPGVAGAVVRGRF
ncbi:MAG: hypothetical protein K8M05_32195 [Deltaproteobacteria bacterium]|nr:hypothetical protein [Kofleriaceae bacterium]